MSVKYDQAFLKTPEGKSIYSRWRNIRNQRCKEWDDFHKFAEWALSNGFSKYLQLKRHDNREEYKPGNCYFYDADNEYVIGADDIKKWNKTVNVIRAHYGMGPVEVNNG